MEDLLKLAPEAKDLFIDGTERKHKGQKRDCLEMMSKRNRFEVAFDNKLRGQDEQAARDGKFRRISTTG
jgi:hypothetical protein